MPLRASWHFPSLDSLAAGHADRYEAFASNPARAGTSVFTRVAAQQVALYAQDQVSWGRWRVAAGVRADVAFGLKSPTFNPTLLDSLGLDNRRTPGTDIYWGPRIGLSYDVRGDGRLFLRGGMGWFGGRPPFDGATQVYSHTGLDEVHIFCEGSAVPAFTTDRARQPSSCLGALSDPIPGPVVVFEPTYRSPRTFETSIGGDARVPGGLVLTADLTYVRGTRQLSLSERNLLPPIGMSAGEAGRPLFGTIDSAGAIVTARRTGAFERVMALGSQGRSRSMSFTVEAQKQLGAGATLAVSYTYSEARDLLSDTEEDLHAVPDFASGSLRPSGWSAPHRLTLLLAADLPLHFAVSVFYAVQSGTPFTYTIDGDANADGYNNDPIFVPTDPRAGGDVSLVVDDGQGGTVPATDSVYGRFATFIRSQTCLHEQRGRLLARNSCRNTSQSETRARVARVFPLGPRSLTLTMDVFNLFNLLRAQWGQVRGLDDPHLLRLAGYDAARGRGIYEFLPRNLRQSDVQASRWRMQLGATLGF
jgi:hypothetical protein